MMQRHLDGGEPDLDSLGSGGHRACEGYWVDVGAGSVYVMLSQPNSIESKLLCERGLFQRLSDGLKIVLRLCGVGEQEVAEFHIFDDFLGLIGAETL
jgi:hypothetical protein